MVWEQSTHERDVLQELERRSSNRSTDLPGDDGPEFSSEPMPAAYGVFYSVCAGLLIIAVLAAVFWR
jgi:hypothetical protein